MKPILNILLVALLAISVSTSKATTTLDNYTYTIHVGAFVKAKSSDFDNIRQYGFLYSKQLNSLQQIYMGDYETEGAANEVIQKVKAGGYPDAFITRRSLDNGNTVTVIQLASKPLNETINWPEYVLAGPLHVLLSGNTVKILTGPFDDLGSAKTQIKQIKKLGFTDAFMKNVNDVLLHEVTDFETGGAIKLPENYEVLADPVEEIVEEIPAPKTKAKKVNIPEPEIIPESYDVVSMMPKSPPPSKTIAAPQIRQDVKRTSVLRLQEILKLEGNYNSSLDGLYGPGTAKAFDNMMATNQEIQKYKLLTKYMPVEKPEVSESTLQRAINTLITNSADALIALQASKAPIAKAYRAYASFVKGGPSQEVNNLMNTAIQEAFQADKLKKRPPFDHKVTYAYNDLGQLIKHLRYIQGTAENETAVPCWLFQRHPEEAKAAYEPNQYMSTSNYLIEDCASSLDWESLKLLETIVNDLNPAPTKVDTKTLADNQSKRSRILLAPKPLHKNDYTNIDNWNTDLWKALDKWAAADPLHKKMILPLKITYFQSWALLEDYFMDKGLQAKDARGLSLCILETLVEPGLSSYKVPEQ